MERSVRRRRVRPQQDAEQHIKLKTDKAGLREHFINPYKGRGVFAVEVFNQGDFVLEYRGKLFKQDGLLTKKYNDTEAVFLFDFKWKGGCWCLDASVEDKSLGRLVNDDHIKPNCKIKAIDVGGMPHLCLFALRDIAPGEEITYNYGDSDWPWRRQQKMAPDVNGQLIHVSEQLTPDVSEQLTPDVRDRPQQQLAPDVSQTIVEESDRPQQQLAPDVSQPIVEENDRPQQQLAPHVNQPIVEESDRPQQQLAPDVNQLTVEESDRPQQLAPHVNQPIVEESDRPQQQLAPDVSQPILEESDIPQQKMAPDVSEQRTPDVRDKPLLSSSPMDASQVYDKININSSNPAAHTSRMAKYRQHHEECFNRHKIAEEERNARERQHTMNLLKRAQLVQQLAQLDTLLTSQSPLHDDIQSLTSSDTSSLGESTISSDPLEDGKPATKTQTTTPLTFATSSDGQRSWNCSVDNSKRTSSRQRLATSYMETSLDESDHTDYSDHDYVPDSEAGSSSEPDEDAPLYPAEKKPLPSLRYPILSPSKQDIDSGSPEKGDSAVSPKKRNLLTQRKRKISSPSPLKSNSNTLEKSRIQQICGSIRVLPPSNSEKRRVYDKRNYCLFCSHPSSKISRHLEAVHGDEAEVALAFQYSKNSKERRNKLNILRRRGNFAHNANVVREGAGELQACYRPRQCKRASEFIHCFHCQGLYSKKTLWKHMKNCPAKEETSDESSSGRRRVRSKCALKTAIVREISEGLKNVISSMTYDEVTRMIQNDKLLLQFGQHLFDLNGSRKNRHDYIRQRLRELGRLLLVAKKNTPIQKAEELIYPSNFNHVISAVKELAGYNTEDNTFRTPSLALKIGNSLGIICELVESDNLSTVDRDWSLVKFAREFKTIKQFRWKGLITRGATTSLRESKWNAPLIIPLTEDVKLLDSHMENVKVVAERMLRLCPSAKNYATLAKVTLAQLIIFNRRREGEVSRMELATFKERRKSELNEDMALCLTPLENKMCDFFTRVEIRGKRGRGVPVLLKPSMVSAMELLADTRELCGVSKENIYMFARPGALSAYRGGECIQTFARESGAKHPEVLTSTRLRKHIATMSQVLNLQENEADQLADFLGHDIRVHRQYYRLPQGTLQLAKMSKMLLAVEKGTLSQYKGQTLDDIEIDPEEKVDSSQDQDASTDEDESLESTTEATGEDGQEPPETAPLLPTTASSSTPPSAFRIRDNTGNSKRKWEDSEVHAVERHMMRFIHTCKVPQKIDCIRCISAEPYALKDRNWTGVKNYVRNRITALKRKACSQDSC
ncbi:uncharacterized protein LOC119017757 isoform X5 [Acanthopagrus latus]|uniref:uncharacterized protein LOC119006959 isoform X5 n=1 Tax=Acanthopagrus latus TaxID=8177 RepID=UPI00187BCD85|nr:uncharacterized protein LOC119006959 isoform X5 [Acanthopagrus latus]XP_036950647.1 uncharacterized protein LOC119017757 isoform X5 [Acanthopagrus latus]